MEKQRISTRTKSFRRLLIVFIFLSLGCANLYSQMLTTVLFKDISIKPENKELLANEDIKFEVDIPSVKSENIKIQTPEEINGVTFKNMRCTQNYPEENGSKIELWFRFSKKGTYTLKPLVVKINNIPKRIEFDPVTIAFNPKEESPVVYLVFSDGTQISSDSEEKIPETPIKTISVGEKVHFSIHMKYGVQLVNYHWDIPKDSIFQLSKEYSIVQNGYNDSKDPEITVPVFDFDWSPLSEGVLSSPVFNFTITNYAGYKYDIKIPSFKIEGTKAEVKSNEIKQSIFDDAFTFVPTEQITKEKVKVTEEDCKRIVELRVKERYSLFDSEKRKEFEQSLGMPGDQREFHLPLLYFSIIASIVFIIGFLIFIKQKRRLLTIFSGLLFITSIVFVITFSARANVKHAISRNCELYSIPENSAESKSELPAGNYVKISEETDNWYYIELGENGGWCIKENLILIN